MASPTSVTDFLTDKILKNKFNIKNSAGLVTSTSIFKQYVPNRLLIGKNDFITPHI